MVRAAWSVKRAKKANKGVSCSSYSTSSLNDQYRTLRVQPGASESDQESLPALCLTLSIIQMYDVRKGSNCGVQFQQINEAYDMVMSRLREETETVTRYQSFNQSSGDDGDEPVYDPDWDMWEEWMGGEGARIRDYTSHINPYI